MRTISVEHQIAHSEPFLAWLREHDVKTEDTYQVDIAADHMTVHQYARGADGAIARDLETGGAAHRPPFTIGIERPVPV